jgi:hypothetical protein
VALQHVVREQLHGCRRATPGCRSLALFLLLSQQLLGCTLTAVWLQAAVGG